MVQCVRVSPSKGVIAVGDSSGCLLLIDRFTFEIVSKSRPHEGAIDFLEFFPGGETLVTKSKDGTMKIWTIGP